MAEAPRPQGAVSPSQVLLTEDEETTTVRLCEPRIAIATDKPPSPPAQARRPR